MMFLFMFQAWLTSQQLKGIADDIEFIEDRYAWHAIIGKRRLVTA